MIQFYILPLLLISVIHGSLTRSLFGQFYHICLYEILKRYVSSYEEFLSKLERKLEEGRSKEVHWQNALKRFEHVRRHIEPAPLIVSEDEGLLLMVKTYVDLTKIAFSNNPFLAEVLFDDALFYWRMLRIKAEDVLDKRKSLLQVLELLRYIGAHYMPSSLSLDIEWEDYYSDSPFLRDLLMLNQKMTTSVSSSSLLGYNADLERAHEIILRQNKKPSDILQKRLDRYRFYSLAVSTLFSDARDELEKSAIRSQLGPLQDYFPGFMRERPTDISRAVLNLTVSKRYLDRMCHFKQFPLNVLRKAEIALAHLCNAYVLQWRKLPPSRAITILTKKLLGLFNELPSKVLDNAIYGCTAKTFDAAVMRYGIPAIAALPLPQDNVANSIADLQRMEARLYLEAFAYRNFYKTRFLNQPEDMEEHFRNSMLMAPEDKEYTALVRSWVKAKTYPNLKMPFIIAKDQAENLFFFQSPAFQNSLKGLKDTSAQKEFKSDYVRTRLDLEMVLYDMSDDQAWKELQWDYIRRLKELLK